MSIVMKKALPMALLLLSGCFSNPLGSSLQSTTFHPGFDQAPRIFSIAPTSGALQGGTLLTIEGSGFVSGAKVKVGEISCSQVTFVTDKTLTCLTPGHGAGSVGITVINPDSQTVTLANGFQYFGSTSLVAGFGNASGGGVATASGVRLRFTAGAFGNPALPTGTGVRANIGVQGTWPHP